MEFYRYDSNKLVEKNTLWDALEIPLRPHMCVSLVGAGGKTSVMYRLAEEMSRKGKRVIVTTSTHIEFPKDRNVLITDQARDVSTVLWNEEILVVGQMSKENKLRGLPIDEITGLSAYADLVLIEADGANRLPLKIPKDHEPVVIPETDLVIACAGLDSIGQTFKKACFRWERAAELLHVQGETKIVAEHLAWILSSELGAKKFVKDKQYRIVLNKADNKGRIADAIEISGKIQNKNPEVCVVTSLLG